MGEKREGFVENKKAKKAKKKSDVELPYKPKVNEKNPVTKCSFLMSEKFLKQNLKSKKIEFEPKDAHKSLRANVTNRFIAKFYAIAELKSIEPDESKNSICLRAAGMTAETALAYQRLWLLYTMSETQFLNTLKKFSVTEKKKKPMKELVEKKIADLLKKPSLKETPVEKLYYATFQKFQSKSALFETMKVEKK